MRDEPRGRRARQDKTEVRSNTYHIARLVFAFDFAIAIAFTFAAWRGGGGVNNSNNSSRVGQPYNLRIRRAVNDDAALVTALDFAGNGGGGGGGSSSNGNSILASRSVLQPNWGGLSTIRGAVRRCTRARARGTRAHEGRHTAHGTRRAKGEKRRASDRGLAKNWRSERGGWNFFR